MGSLERFKTVLRTSAIFGEGTFVPTWDRPEFKERMAAYRADVPYGYSLKVTLGGFRYMIVLTNLMAATCIVVFFIVLRFHTPDSWWTIALAALGTGVCGWLAAFMPYLTKRLWVGAGSKKFQVSNPPNKHDFDGEDPL